jgi:hypothetical protein
MSRAWGRSRRRRLINQLCADAVQRHRVLDRTANSDQDSAMFAIRLGLVGEIIGIRIALCHLHGWNPLIDSDKEGRADTLITDWWQKSFPKEWK